MMLALGLAVAVAFDTDTLLVTADWVAARQADPAVVLLHVGGATDYRDGHIPGARLVDLMRVHSHGAHGMPPAQDLRDAFEAAGVSDQSRIVLYGSGMSAAIAFVALEHIGLGNRASVLDGGLSAWRANGGVVSTTPAEAARGQLGPMRPGQAVADAGWILPRLKGTGIAILDARTPAEYAGTARESLPRTGHLPGARLLEWTQLTDSVTGKFLPPAELQALFASRGVAPGDTVVSYCTVGMRASQLYFAARLLGHPARMYAGSMMDWAARTELPIRTGPEPD